MTSRAQTREGRFVEVSWGFHGILVGSILFLPLRLMMLEKVLRVGAMRHWFYMAAKPPHMGIIVDRLACPLHRPMACSHQTRGQGLLPGGALSCCYSGWWRLPKDVKPPGHGYLMEY
jgi:hypothetical protein